ncbi:DUF6708 domain-containing protein [Lelliottia wanjuensis]|uniref:DUF6708 domain-containing protein n=1 Tax=Lelliottia wanjuensis TaxID=3050585 RepID=UPI00254F9951|nr:MULTISPECIES: DUF6708 domain-containing protein [unclassified Lelliottia]MDK9355799.1 hypothetical protein [Lelliottia sp. V106_16]MDK9373936.1 hypothetical protein [Lelliottia sp. V106_10]MDK9583875.1 hypothetical protein [Lelliottia sp. V86_10]MDK9601692.1 hypothetical protein [Lelliottia sp. V106_5]
MKAQDKQPDSVWPADAQTVRDAVNARFSSKPRLTPPLKGWEEDLPGNKEPQTVIGQLIRVTEINDTWLEMPRYENIMWGGALFSSAALLAPLMMFFYSIFIVSSNLLFLIVSIVVFFIVLSIFWLNLRMALFVPRDQPIRFNRKRQKIYIFDYHRNHWNPWGKWPATVKVFDWADIHGEIGHESDRYVQGFRLYCAVCKPGTHEVIERFILNQAMSHPEPQRRLWSHLCQYMQHKPVVMDPVYPGRPDNWKPRKNMCWPEELERESTMAL